MISHDTIREMGKVMREIEVGQKLLLEVEAELAKDNNRVDFHGRPESSARKCQLGWPGSENSYRLYNVEPRIARSVIVAHLANEKANLEKLNEVARLEILGEER